MEDPPALARLFRGADLAFLISSQPSLEPGVIDAAAHADVRHRVKRSALARGTHSLRRATAAEQHLALVAEPEPALDVARREQEQPPHGVRSGVREAMADAPRHENEVSGAGYERACAVEDLELAGLCRRRSYSASDRA